MILSNLCKHMTIRKRLTVLILLAVFVITALSGLNRIRATEENTHRSVADKLDLLAALAAGSLAEPLWSYNDNALKDICDTFFKDREVGRVTVRTATGISVYDNSINSPIYEQSRLIVDERAVFKQNTFIGTVSIGLTTHYREIELRNEIFNIIGSILLMGIVLSFLIAYVSRMVTKPLYQLSEGTDEIAGGNFTKRLAIDADDEVGRLADKFNRMTDNIQSMMGALQQSEERFRTVVTHTPIIIYALDKDGVFTLSEGLGLRKLGLASGEVVGQSSLMVYRDDPKIVEYLTRALAGEAVFLEHQLGDTWFDNRMVPVFDETDRLTGVIGAALDITGRVKAEGRLQESYEELTATHEELLASEEELRSVYAEIIAANAKLSDSNQMIQEIFNAANDIIAVFDSADGAIVSINRKASELFGYSEEELKSRGLISLVSPANIEESLQKLRLTIREGPQTYERKLTNRHGRPLIFEVKTSPVVIRGKTYCLALLRDITARRLMEDHVEFLRVRDPMTGVYNRAFFETEILQVQTGGYSGIGLFVCDVDGLKLINDTLGHRQGDDLLKQVATLLQGGVKAPNHAARIGGDEFVVILFEPTKRQMEDLDQYYRQKVLVYNQQHPHLPLSLSIGWAMDGDCTHIDTVFKEADNNMYRQKLHQSQSVRGSIVQTMMKALEARDHITEGHAVRLGDLMEGMGQKLGLPQGAMADLRLFANFHDIGKVGIPDSILKKPGRLSEEEMAIMRQHCEIGFRIAKSSPDLAPIADWILKHQEHWDGRGYPLGIHGEAIPVQCRILGIVDAFDAMTSDRPYRKAMDREEALAEIRRCSGTQFDPELVENFLVLLEQDLQ
ncbi:MAG: PAS domain S-box protein [Negativicutes bacterium]|nr:PAS domain S-box protein [Negativicutes bacterium]